MKFILTTIATLVMSWAILAQNFVESPQSNLIQVGASTMALANINNSPNGSLEVFISGRRENGDVQSRLYGFTSDGAFTSVPAPGLPAFSNGDADFADIDGDGDQDIIVAGIAQQNNQAVGDLYTNSGSGFFTVVPGSPIQAVQWASVAFTDADNDNDQDLVVSGRPLTSGTGQTILYGNLGNNNFIDAMRDLPEVREGAIAVADVDGDGDEDLFVTGREIPFGGPQILIANLYLNDGFANYALASGNPFVGVDQSTVDFADVDNDGDQDVFITGRDGSGGQIAKLYYQVGTGFYVEALDQPFVGVEFGDSEFADVDNDGDMDLIVTGNTSSFSFDPSTRLYLNNGVGSYSFVETDIIDVYASSVVFNDFDGDGDSDLIVSGFTDNTSVATVFYLNEPIILVGDQCDGAESVDNLFGGPENVAQTSDRLSNIGYSNTGDPEENCFQFDGIDAGRWFSFTGDGNTYRIAVPTCGGENPMENDDTQIIVYEGSCNGLTQVGCNDDETGTSFAAGLTINTTNGQVYSILIDGYGGGFTGGGQGNPEGEFCLEVTNLGVSSLRYTETLNVELFPNPASDQVTLRFGSLQLSIQAQIFIRDLNGRPVWHGAPQGTQMTIPTDHLSAGTYIVELRDAGQLGRRRLIIQ
ncbi:MAG: T9SS type A sorting domain-containing protein [Bacteroidota bacterium]